MSVHGYTDEEYENEYGSEADNVTLISKLDISNPLHLRPNDSATLTVVSVKLKGTENYQVWSYTMLLALEGKNKTRAKHVWDELKETYDKVNGYATFNLNHKVNSLSQNGSPIADYYHKLNALWKQFNALVQLPRCTCHAAGDFKKHNSLMKLMQFLMGLDDSYMQIRSNILSGDPLPDVRGAYAIISSEESHRVVSSSNVGTSQRSQSSVFNTSVNNRGFTQRTPISYECFAQLSSFRERICEERDSRWVSVSPWLAGCRLYVYPKDIGSHQVLYLCQIAPRFCCPGTVLETPGLIYPLIYQLLRSACLA
ncbi:ribonuclease H-like domain-containing protein [Tanacetum coccineum]|uniref:Ribonuclease H-like domain-containing protein n=1 Tax=Tanacetum coccineum TaxID=301880 RepID=A0ABQ5DT78_9ASTR